LRSAVHFNVPFVFQHHTMYGQYTHYVPGDSRALKRFVIDLATGYANLCDCVFAPNESVAQVLRQRGVRPPITVVPTGIDEHRFAHGDGCRMRSELRIPSDVRVVGHVGRLAPEEDLPFLARAVLRFLCY
jgi:glycosyltransferase involved in cell wall biosynthesis